MNFFVVEFFVFLRSFNFCYPIRTPRDQISSAWNREEQEKENANSFKLLVFYWQCWNVSNFTHPFFSQCCQQINFLVFVHQ